jgi:hypothetical protein
VPLLLLLAVAFTVVVLLVQGAPIYLAYRMPHLLPEAPADGATAAPVSVVIAARNEEEAIGGCLDDLLQQTYPDLEIVVVDGGSTDGTRERVRQRSRVRLLEEPPLPPGWVGKSWACWTGAQATQRPWILFADADVRLDPAAVGTLVGWARREEADLASFAARIETRTLWERIVLPFTTQMVLLYFRASHTNRDGSSAAIANGQFFVVRRDAYLRVGGHRSIAGLVLEDVALARQFRAAGLRLRLAWTPELVTTRMYADRREMFEGLLKNAHDTEFSAARQLGLLLGLFAFYELPLAVLPVGLLLGSGPVAALGGLLYVALFGKHAAFAKATVGRAVDGLFFPVAAGFYLVVLATSLVRGLRGRPVRWKGRDYALGPGAAP